MSLGIGVFAFPSALYKIGYVSGISLILFVAYITNMSQILFIRITEEINLKSYEEIVEHVLGKFGSFYLGISMCLCCLLLNAAHLNVVSHLLYEIIL